MRKKTKKETKKLKKLIQTLMPTRLTQTRRKNPLRLLRLRLSHPPKIRREGAKQVDLQKPAPAHVQFQVAANRPTLIEMVRGQIIVHSSTESEC